MSESKTKAVFTTVHVIEENSPIVYVSHDMDGDWQFFGSEEDVEMDKARVVLLEEIINIDPSVEQLLDMPIGTAAYRNSKESEWIKAAKN